MRELEMLREQTQVLRDLAARSSNSYGMKDKFLALAKQCEELADGREKALKADAVFRGAPPGQPRLRYPA